MQKTSPIKRPIFASIALAVTLALSPIPFALAEEGFSKAQQQELINNGFKKGKNLYDAGRYEEAFREWDTFAAYLDETSSVRRVIEFLKKRAPADALSPSGAASSSPAPAVFREAGALAAPTAGPKDVEVPAEIRSLLESIAVQAESDRRAAEKKPAETGEAARRVEKVRAAFEKGRQAYYSGDLDQALADWEPLASLVEDGESIRRFIASIRADREAAAKALKSSAPAPTPRAPEELLRELERASLKVKAEAAEARARRQKAESMVATSAAEERFARETFERGRSLFENGKTAEAIAEWEKLPPSAVIGPALAELKKNYHALQETPAAPNIAREIELASSTKELAAFLESASRRMRAELSEARARLAAQEEPLRARAGAVESAFENGKLFYYQGRYEDALVEWEKAVSELKDDSDVKRRFQELRQAHADVKAAKRAASEVSSRTDRKLEASPEFARLFEQADQKMRSELKQIEAERTRLDSVAADRRARVDAAFREGQARFAAGEYGQAFEEWNRMLPHLDDASGTRLALESLKERHNEYLLARKAASELGVKKNQTMSVPAGDIAAFLEQASGRFEVDRLKAQAQRASLEKTVSERQAWVDATFKNGQALYQAGKIEEAIEEWSKILIYADDKSETGKRLERLKQEYENALAQKKAAEAALTRRPSRVVSPAELADALDKATGELRAQAEAARSDKAAADRSAAERDKTVRAAIENGRVLFEESRFDEAVTEWEKAISGIDAAPALARRVESLRAAAKSFEAAKTEAAAAAQREKEKMKAPEELDALLEKAAQAFAVSARESASLKERAESSASERRAAVDAAFQKGKALYREGRVREALDEWKAILPHLREEEFLRPFFESAEKAQAESEAVGRAASASAARQKDRLPAPPELSKLLDDAARRARQEAADAQESRQRNDAAFAQRSAAARATYERGQALYQSGDVEGALKEWAAVAVQVAEENELKGRLEAVAGSRAAALEARRAADAAAARQSGRLRAPEGFAQTLDAAAKRLQADRAAAEAEKANAERALLERQKTIEASFQNAKALFEKGKYEEGLAQWKKLAPYLENDAEAKERLAALSQGHAEAIEAKKAAVRAAADEYKGIRLPETFLSELVNAEQALKGGLQAAQAERSRSELNVQERRAWAEATFKKASEAFAAGHYEKAMEEWNSILPHLEESSEAAPIMESLKARLAEVVRAEKAAETARVQQSARLTAPEEALRSLQQASARLVAQAQAAEKTRVESDQALAARRGRVEAALEKARASAHAGRYEEAVAQWNAALPELENAAEAAKLLESVNEARAAASAAEAASKQAAAAQSAKLKTPPDLPKAFSMATDALRARTDAAQKEKMRAESLAAERQAWVKARLAKGKSLYEAGNYEQALAEWKETLPYLEEALQLRAFVEEVEKSLAESHKARADAQAALTRAGQPTPAPAGLAEALAEADGRMKADTQKSIAERQRAEKILADKKELQSAVFQKGKQLHEAGKYEEAVAEWESLEPSFKNDPELKAAMAGLRAGYEKYEAAIRASAEFAATEYKALKAPFSAEMQNLLARATADFSSKTNAAREEKVRMESALLERQAWIRSTFEKGKAHYDAGRFAEAFELWDTLTPYLENEAQSKQSLARARVVYDEYAQARRSAEEATARQSVKLPVPDGLSALVAEARAKLQKETETAATVRAAAEKSAADRETFVRSNWEAGRRAYDEGRFAAAAAAWSNMVPHVEGGEKLKSSLDALAAAESRTTAARQTASQAAALKDAKLKIPDALTDMLARGREKLEKETQAALAAQASADKAVADRRAFVESTLAAGRAAFEAGRYAEASDLWSKMLPHLDQGERLAPSLIALAETEERLTAAQREAAETADRQRTKLPPPQGLASLLEKTDARLKADLEAARAKRASVAATFDARRAGVTAAFEEGRKFHEAGRHEEALTAWRKMLPEIEGADAIKASIDAVSKKLFESRSAQVAAEEAAAWQNTKFEVPRDLAKHIGDIREKFAQAALSAGERRKAAEAAAAGRQTEFRSIYQKGKALYDAGDLPAALAVWKSMAPYLGEPGPLEGAIAGLEKDFAAAQTAHAQADEAARLQGRKLALPEGLETLLAETDRKLKSDAAAAAAERERLEKSAADRKAALASAYQKGKALFEAGKTEEAFAEWEKMGPALEAEPKLKATLAALRACHKEFVSAQRATADFAANEFNRIRVPYAEEMEKFLAAAAAKFASQATDAEKQKAQMQATLSDRQAWIQATFEKGKAAYDVGRHAEAFEQWDAITPYLENEARMKQSIQRSRVALEQALAVKKAAEEAAALRDAKFKAPDALAPYLEQATQKSKAAAQAAASEKAMADKALEDRRLWVTFTFQDGKNLYDAGKYREAAELWSTLAPHLENGEAVKAALQKLMATREEAERARRGVQEAVAKQEMKFQAPEDVVTLISLAERQLQEEAAKSEAQRAKAQQILKQRQEWIDATFRKGKAAYEGGGYDEAIKEWGTLLPYLEGAQEAEHGVQALSEAYRQALEARRAAGEAESLKDQKLATPAELEKLLREAVEQLRADSLQAQLKQNEAKETVGERRARVDEAFRKGKALYQNEQYDEALQAWSSILPEVDRSEEVERLIASVAENRVKAIEAKRQAQAALAGQTAKIRIPEELPALLQEADAALKAQAFDAQTQKTKAEQTAQERQAWVAETFQRGKAFYDQGRYRDAALEWAKLAPYAGEKSGIPELIESVKQSEQDTLEAKKSAVEAVANEYKGLKLNYSDQIAQLLEDAGRKLKAEAVENQKKRSDIETAMAERREWSTTTFNKGKILYEQGRVEEALAQWDRLLPYLDGDSRVRQLIQSIKIHYETLLASRTETNELSQKEKAGDVPYLKEMTQFFEAAGKKLSDDASDARSRAEEAGKIIARRKEWIESAYKKGRELFDSGRHAEAVQAWDTLRPYLAETPEVHKKIEDAKKAYQDAENAEKAAAAAEAKKKGLPELPKDAELLIASYTKPAASPVPSASKPKPAPSAVVGGQFVSGEVTAVDSEQKTITMKLYTVNKEKNLVIHFDAGTQVDGSRKDVQAGNAIDMRYDPATKKALYIYVY